MIFKILVWYFVIASGAVKIDFCFFICLSLSLSFLSLWLSFHYLQRSICPRDPGQKAPRFIDPSNFPWVPVLSPYFSAWSMSSVPNHPAMPGPCPDHAPLHHTIVPLLKSVPWISGISSFLSSQCENTINTPWLRRLPSHLRCDPGGSPAFPNGPNDLGRCLLRQLGNLLRLWCLLADTKDWLQFDGGQCLSQPIICLYYMSMHIYIYIHMHPYWTCFAVISCGK